jgi:hypothetical protein
MRRRRRPRERMRSIASMRMSRRSNRSM